MVVPALPMAKAVGLVAAVEMVEEVLEPETELMSRDLLEERFSEQDGSHIDNIQILERMKGKLSSVLQDLEGEPTMELSVGDWEKLSSARERHALDVQKEKLEEVAQKEQRKQERAAKRAARKVAAEVPRGPEEAVSRSTLTAPSAANSRRSARSTPARARGARATAGSRTRTHATWGKQRAGEVEESQLFAKSLGKTQKDYFPTGNDAVADFLRNMPAHKLLTKADEATLAIKIQDWLSLQERFNELEAQMGRTPSNSEWAAEFGQSEGEFMERWKDGNRARHKMLTCNQRLVVSIARRYQDKGLDLADLIAEGMNGLIRSVEKFDHTKGFKFSTYATWWVRQSITRSIGDLSKTIRLPCHLNEMLGKIARCEREFVNDHRRAPKIEELAAMLKMPVDKVQMIRTASSNPRALEDPLKQGDPESSTIGDGLEDNSEAQTQAAIVQHSMQVDMDMVLSTLSTREHGILRMRYGLDDGEPKTLEDIGNAFHVTRERIRQIENKALAKLKDPTRHSTLQPYLTGAALECVTGDPGWKSGINRDSSQ